MVCRLGYQFQRLYNTLFMLGDGKKQAVEILKDAVEHQRPESEVISGPNTISHKNSGDFIHCINMAKH